MSYSIVQCTEQHRIAVLRWLRKEHRTTGGEGFWVNRKVIGDFALSDVFVIISQEAPIGFVSLTGNGDIDLLEIRPDHRNRGAGSQLALFAIQELWNRGHQAIRINCCPPESITFWWNLGFERIDPTLDFPIKARQYRQVVLDLADESAARTVAVQVQHLSSQQRDEPHRIVRTTEVNGLQVNQRVCLPRRIILCRDDTDDEIKIVVDDRVIHQGRIKYLDREQYGVQRVSRDQFFLDYVDF
jgi:GNAT superfamily N-acetyltransferase